MNGRWTLFESTDPHQGRRHVDVGVGGVDGQIRSVDAIAEDAIVHAYLRSMLRHVPFVRVHVRHRKRSALSIHDPEVEDVLREVVQRVASGRGSAHQQLQRHGRQIAQRHVDVHQPVVAIRERQRVGDGSLRERIGNAGKQSRKTYGGTKKSSHVRDASANRMAYDRQPAGPLRS